jgi:hypothetical protein
MMALFLSTLGIEKWCEEPVKGTPENGIFFIDLASSGYQAGAW